MDTRDYEKSKKLLEEKTFFKDIINIETGELSDEYDEDKTVIIEFNNESLENFSKVLQAILEMRGIKDPDEIDRNDHDVKEVIRKRLANKKGDLRGRRAKNIVLTEQEISSIVNGAIRTHKPHFNAALVQVIQYVLLVNNLFYMERDGSIATRFEIQLDDDYWNNINRVIGSSSIIDNVLSQSQGSSIFSPFYNKDNPLEIMIAYSTRFLEEHPNVSDKINDEYLKGVLANITLSSGGSSIRRLDTFQTFSDILDGLLSDEVEQGDDVEQGEQSGTGVGNTSKKIEPEEKPRPRKQGKSDGDTSGE